MKSLVVDDDFSNRLVLQRFLGELGEVHVAANGEEAVNAVRLSLEAREPYQLICLDIMMPGTDGEQALQAIRELEHEFSVQSGHHARVVMTTALNDRQHVLSAFEKQADAYLLKPVLKPRLLETVRQWGLM